MHQKPQNSKTECVESEVQYDELAFYVKSLIGIAICDMIYCNDKKFCVTFLTPYIYTYKHKYQFDYCIVSS